MRAKKSGAGDPTATTIDGVGGGCCSGGGGGVGVGGGGCSSGGGGGGDDGDGGNVSRGEGGSGNGGSGLANLLRGHGAVLLLNSLKRRGQSKNSAPTHVGAQSIKNSGLPWDHLLRMIFLTS